MLNSSDIVFARMQARPSGVDDVAVTSRIAGAAGTVIRRLQSPRAVSEALQALLSGDLQQPGSNGQVSAGLTPFYPPGKRKRLFQPMPLAKLFAVDLHC